VEQAGPAGQPQRLLEHVSAGGPAAAPQHQVEELSVLLRPVVAQVDEVLHVVAGAHVADVLVEDSGTTARRRYRTRTIMTPSVRLVSLFV